MSFAIWSSPSSASCLDLRDLNQPTTPHYEPLCKELQDLSPPPLPNDQVRIQRFSRIFDSSKFKNLSRSHAASLAKAARQISLRDADHSLSKKARWLIILIGFIMFGMSILLVGITLKLAPWIDEIVRKEHEDLLRKMNHTFNYQLPVQHNNNNETANNSSENSGLLQLTEVYHIDGQLPTAARPP